MNLACRACRVPLSAIAGCALCDPVRQNLVVVGEQEEDRPSLAGVSAEAVAAIRKQLATVRVHLKTNEDDLKAEGRLIGLTNSLTKLVGEARKLQDDGKKAIENMAFAERAELFIEWYAALPPAYRQSMRERMADHEVQVAAPIQDEKALS